MTPELRPLWWSAGSGSFSSTGTLAPERAACNAALAPIAPEPTTSTSASRTRRPTVPTDKDSFRGRTLARSGVLLRVLVTGGAGFIGSNFVHHLFHAHAGTSTGCCPDHA